MLVLDRKEGQQVRIGETVLVTILKTTSGRVKIGINAPPNIVIWREELHKSRNEEHKDRSATEEGGHATD